MRVVRTPEGRVEVDPTGKRNGRGAYLHADPDCWEAALKRKSLQQALKVEISEADRAALAAFGAGMASTAGDEQSPPAVGTEQKEGS